MHNELQAPTTILSLNQELPKLTEKTFVNKWLLTLHAYMRGEEVAIGIWLQENDITAFTEVAITDSTGNELYRVPSIFARKEKILPNRVAESIGDILYRADNMNKTIPGKGNVFIREEITSHVNNSESIVDYEKRWDIIFTKYGLDPVFSNTVNGSNGVDSTDGDFDEYEEL